MSIMDEMWVAVIGVAGALLGGLSGSWMTARVSRQTQEAAYAEQRRRERRESFCEAINALFGYRHLEIKRVMEALQEGVSIDQVPTAQLAREARATCRYHLVVLRVLMPGEDIPRRYAELLDLTHNISRESTPSLAEKVKVDIETLAEDFGSRAS